MGIKVIAAPSVEPITLAEAKIHIRVESDVTGDDDLISALIIAAREHCEAYTIRSLITQTLELALDEFPCEIELSRHPVQSITSIKYLDSDSVEQTLSSANYTLDDYSFRHWALLAYGESWPSTYASANAVKVRYVAGYGLAGDVPAQIKQAMLLLIGHLYENREASAAINISEIPLSINMLLSPYRVIKL